MGEGSVEAGSAARDDSAAERGQCGDDSAEMIVQPSKVSVEMIVQPSEISVEYTLNLFLCDFQFIK